MKNSFLYNIQALQIHCNAIWTHKCTSVTRQGLDLNLNLDLTFKPKLNLTWTRQGLAWLGQGLDWWLDG